MGSCLSYKACIATNTVGFVTAISASPSSLHDTGGIPNLVESHEKLLGTPLWIAADIKYGSEECLKYLQDKGIKTSIKPEVKNNRHLVATLKKNFYIIKKMTVISVLLEKY